MTATLAPPDRSLTQRMAALEKGNHIRRARSWLKRDLKREQAPDVWVWAADELIAAPTPDLETMKIYDLLVAMPAIGSVRANRILRAARCSPSKTLGGLSVRQRRSLRSVVYTHALRYREHQRGR
jgi:hypothetical protein